MPWFVLHTFFWITSLIVYASGASEPETCIIGGGAAGIYTGYRLKQLGRPFQLLEKSDRLGGNCEHIVTDDGYSISLGVQLLPNQTAYTDILDDLDVEYRLFDISSLTMIDFIDFRTGLKETSYTTTPYEQYLAYDALLTIFQNEPWLEDFSVNYPDVIPEYLAVPYAEFQVTHGLTGLYPLLRALGAGHNFQTLPTVMALQLLRAWTLEMVTGRGLVLPKTCEDVYTKMSQDFLSDVSLGVVFENLKHNNKGDDTITIRYRDSTGAGTQVIECSEVIIAHRQSASTMAGYGLDNIQLDVFSRVQESFFGTAAIVVPGYFTAPLHWNTLPLSEDPFGMTGANATIHFTTQGYDYINGRLYLNGQRLLASDSITELNAALVDDLTRIPGILGEPVIVASKAHAFGWYPLAGDRTIYGDLKALQGYRNMYYIGATPSFESQMDVWLHAEKIIQEFIV
eukprot:Lithocolla_globosa_v1_NODE_85_length_6671_cov_4.306832.p2 type:complete len:455 gc:universal NODE_85_length_6671_cov_4.306832:1689-3053(+)